MNTQEDKYSIAVNQDGMALESVPEHLRTPQLCLDAVKNDGWALEFVPENLKTPEMCRVALQSSPDLGGGDCEIMAYIPFPDICLEGLKDFKNMPVDPMELFSCINPQIMTEEIARFGVQMEPSCFKLLPERLKTQELCMEAVKGDSLLLGNIPKHLITQEMVDFAVRDQPHCLRYVPKNMCTPELCLEAVKANERVKEYVPDTVSKGNNLYTFYKKVEDAINKPLTCEEHKRLYAGESILVGNVQTKGNFSAPCCQVSYNMNYKSLNLKKVTSTMGQTQEQKADGAKNKFTFRVPKSKGRKI